MLTRAHRSMRGLWDHRQSGHLHQTGNGGAHALEATATATHLCAITAQRNIPLCASISSFVQGEGPRAMPPLRLARQDTATTTA